MRPTACFVVLALAACKERAIGRAPSTSDARHDVSFPLRDLPPATPLASEEEEQEERDAIRTPLLRSPLLAVDPVRQDFHLAGQALQLATSFEGIGWNFPIPGSTKVWNATWQPADPNGDVGPRHFVQVTNGGFVVFDKSGAVVYGPAYLRTLYRGFGGKCETDAESDPTVRYDALADRWLISHQTNGMPPNVQCVSVSTSGDPTGQYARYEFDYADGSPDFTKFAVWPDAYYLIHDITLPAEWLCALDRSAMLRGASAAQQCFPGPSGTPVALAADLEGTSVPPAGAAAIILAANLSDSSSTLTVYRVHIDWGDRSKSAMDGPVAVPISPVTNTFAGIPQPGTPQILSPMEGHLQNRLVYRNFGDHESIVGSLPARSGDILGIRWFEVRMPSGEPALYQEGTYVPDSDHRFVGSVAMDVSGGIALAYSISSDATYAGARFTGRATVDPLGVMTQPEGTLVSGQASQEHTLRWGDYGNLAVDPVDGCTFWYSAVYMRPDSNASKL